jgi:hypothetical protein
LYSVPADLIDRDRICSRRTHPGYYRWQKSRHPRSPLHH